MECEIKVKMEISFIQPFPSLYSNRIHTKLNDHQISSEQTLPFFWLSDRNVEITLQDILLGKLDEESDLSNYMLICKVSYPMGQDVDEVSTQTLTYFRD